MTTRRDSGKLSYSVDDVFSHTRRKDKTIEGAKEKLVYSSHNRSAGEVVGRARGTRRYSIRRETRDVRDLSYLQTEIRDTFRLDDASRMRVCKLSIPAPTDDRMVAEYLLIRNSKISTGKRRTSSRAAETSSASPPCSLSRSILRCS